MIDKKELRLDRRDRIDFVKFFSSRSLNQFAARNFLDSHSVISLVNRLQFYLFRK